MTLLEHLKTLTKNKDVFSLRELKKTFKTDKTDIDSYLFIGLLIPASEVNPDAYRATIY